MNHILWLRVLDYYHKGSENYSQLVTLGHSQANILLAKYTSAFSEYYFITVFLAETTVKNSQVCIVKSRSSNLVIISKELYLAKTHMWHRTGLTATPFKPF